MALVARMQASEVTGRGGGRWVSCREEDDGARPVAEAGVSSMYGIPPWLTETGFVRYEEEAQNSEYVKFTAVSAKGKDDPNREWAMASPSGNLDLNIQNPAAFGYVKAGDLYRVTIEKIRGPRNFTVQYDSAGMRVAEGSETS